MGRKPCCAKEGLNRGAWTAMEDKILTDYIKVHGEGKWRNLPIKAGLKRCGKSCRLRWLNYLKPDVKRGNISCEEEDLIVRLHKLLGNRWSLIAGRLPGRTDNEIKNYWNTNIGKKLHGRNYKITTNLNCKPTRQADFQDHQKVEPSLSDSQRNPPPPQSAVRTKATRCSKVFIPQQLQMKNEHKYINVSDDKQPADLEATEIPFDDHARKIMSDEDHPQASFGEVPTWALHVSNSSELKMDQQFLSRVLEVDLDHHEQEHKDEGHDLVSSSLSEESLFLNEDMECELDTDWIASFLGSELDWSQKTQETTD